MANPLQAITSLLIRRQRDSSPIEMWKNRAKKFGPRAVLNLGHSADELGNVTKRQQEIIFPIVERQLTGAESVVLDLGCGPGRFTSDLSTLIGGRAIGVDPIQRFLDLAPKFSDVEYRQMDERTLPVSDRSVDVVWICLVLGGLVDDGVLKDVISEVRRVLKPGGLIALTENTSSSPDSVHWKFRSVEFYMSLFDYADLQHMADYDDLGERISILVGRRKP